MTNLIPTAKSDRKLTTSGERRFRFGVLADTHLGALEGESPSPWETNKLDSARLRGALAELEAHKPDFIIHLGDMVHPLPNHPLYMEAVGRFLKLVENTRCALNFVPGNHDIGDKHANWMPAELITERFIKTYNEAFGADRYCFEHKGSIFIVINAQLVNSGLDSEGEQFSWLERTLAANAGRRIFVFSHYPLYLTEPTEEEHYDNIAEPGRSRLLNILVSYDVEMFVSGHVHNFFYNVHGNTEMYTIPATTAVRHDYSFLFDVPPPDLDEFGRNDIGKLGFCVVDIYETGHVVHFRSFLEVSPKSQNLDAHPKPALASPKLGRTNVGVDLRGSWATPVSLPFSGVVDEFYRKNVRNDYLVNASWTIGADLLRIPVADLACNSTRDRVYSLRRGGQRIGGYFFNAPNPTELEILKCNDGIFDFVELIADQQNLAKVSRLGVPKYLNGNRVFLSKLHSSSEAKQKSEVFTHYIMHGFDPRDIQSAEIVNASKSAGAVFRVNAFDDVLNDIDQIGKLCRSADCEAKVYLRLTGKNPARSTTSHVQVANSVLEAVFSVFRHRPFLDLIIDTLIDVDRGYFPRLGLFDRRYNPNLGARAVRTANALLARLGEGEVSLIETSEEHAKLITLAGPDVSITAVLPLVEESGTGGRVDLRFKKENLLDLYDLGVACPNCDSWISCTGELFSIVPSETTGVKAPVLLVHRGQPLDFDPA